MRRLQAKKWVSDARQKSGERFSACRIRVDPVRAQPTMNR
jgi:hypothetical protein